MSLSDPIKCIACFHEVKADWLEKCPTCGGDNLQYPEPSDEEITDRLIIAPWEFCNWSLLHLPLMDGKESRDGAGHVLCPGDEVMLYDRIWAQVFRVIMPQGWLLVRLIATNLIVPSLAKVGPYKLVTAGNPLYQISSALTYAIYPRAEILPEVIRVPRDQ